MKARVNGIEIEGTPEQIAIVDDSNARQMRIADRLLAHRRQEVMQR